MAAQVETTELVKQMSGKNTLNGWDVLVSYNEAQINNLLNIRASALPGLSSLKFTVEEEGLDEDPETGKPTMKKTDWEFKLTQPLLQFVGSQGRIRLSFAFSGSKTSEGSTARFGTNLRIQLETDLLNVQGTLSDTKAPTTAEFVPASDATRNATGSKSIVLMGPSDGAAQAVCINLVDDKMSLEIVSTATPPKPISEQLILVQQRLREHIRNAVGLKYYIAGLTNVYSPSAGSNLLKPKTFCFTCVPGNPSANIPGTLCMYIGVEGGEAGDRPSGQTAVTFHPGDADLHPIPKDSTASVIFSHRLMSNYIVSAMKAKNIYDTFSISSNVGIAGIEVTARCNKTVKKSFSQYSKISEWEFLPVPGFRSTLYSNVEFNMHDEDTVFTFGKQDDFKGISIAYLSGEQHLTWYNDVLTLTTAMPELKHITLKFAHGGTGTWTDDRTPNTKTPNMLKLQFTLPNTFQPKDKKVTADYLLFDVNADAPEHYQTIDIPLPNLDLDLAGLDYFLTTNLILPGAHLFIADEPTGKAGPNHGLFMPRDVLLTGKVATELKAVQ